MILLDLRQNNSAGREVNDQGQSVSTPFIIRQQLIDYSPGSTQVRSWGC